MIHIDGMRGGGMFARLLAAKPFMGHSIVAVINLDISNMESAYPEKPCKEASMNTGPASINVDSYQISRK